MSVMNGSLKFIGKFTLVNEGYEGVTTVGEPSHSSVAGLSDSHDYLLTHEFREAGRTFIQKREQVKLYNIHSMLPLEFHSKMHTTTPNSVPKCWGSIYKWLLAC